MTGTSLALGVVWLLGCLTGYAHGYLHGYKRHAADDKISNGVRGQMRKVRDSLRFVGEGWESTSRATATTIDGEFEIVVRQAAHPTHTNDRGEEDAEA